LSTHEVAVSHTLAFTMDALAIGILASATNEVLLEVKELKVRVVQQCFDVGSELCGARAL
jgi:hypothetical protein